MNLPPCRFNFKTNYSLRHRWNALLLSVLLLQQCNAAPTQKDVIRIMTYNVMRYGDGCQGPNADLHNYLKTILTYVKPDIIGLVKIEAIPGGGGSKGKAPVGFADSILNNAVNKAFPDRFSYCPLTNVANDNKQSLLLYNKHKLALASYTILVSDESDFNLYKLFYLDPNLAKTHDTMFLYVILVHTDSGDNSDDRDRQQTEIMAAIRKRFASLPNMIIMGDFNLRKSSEPGYQLLTGNAEQQYRFADPPFAIDKKVTYPANWEKHPERFAPFLTTSTRKKSHEPNDCGTGGGAKAWYDHILLSPSLISPSNSFHYVPGSYHTIGNDGNRIDASVIDQPNKSAPAEVLSAFYQMSNKYPVTLDIGISPR